MLKSLAHVLRGGLESQLSVIMEDIKRCLKDKSQVSGQPGVVRLRFSMGLTYFSFLPPCLCTGLET